MSKFRTDVADEIASYEVEPLPERAAMSLVNANAAIPINAALALNALSDNSIAAAGATQNTPITQTTGGGGLPGLG